MDLGALFQAIAGHAITLGDVGAFLTVCTLAGLARDIVRGGAEDE